MPDRFRLSIFLKGEPITEEFHPTLARTKSRIRAFKSENPSLIRTHDVFVEDQKEGTEFHVDQEYNLIEM